MSATLAAVWQTGPRPAQQETFCVRMKPYSPSPSALQAPGAPPVQRGPTPTPKARAQGVDSTPGGRPLWACRTRDPARGIRNSGIPALSMPPLAALQSTRWQALVLSTTCTRRQCACACACLFATAVAGACAQAVPPPPPFSSPLLTPSPSDPPPSSLHPPSFVSSAHPLGRSLDARTTAGRRRSPVCVGAVPNTHCG